VGYKGVWSEFDHTPCYKVMHIPAGRR